MISKRVSAILGETVTEKNISQVFKTLDVRGGINSRIQNELIVAILKELLSKEGK